MLFEENKIKIAIVGLGYVGLPLALEFSKKFKVVGYDVNKDRISELKNSFDRNQQIEKGDFNKEKNINFTYKIEKINDCNIYIITVPTPIDKFKKPDLSYLLSASKVIGKSLKKGDIVIYESTVYPGCTEEDCVPILANESGLIFNIDFFCGYSPERINPGDKENTLTSILKLTSGSTLEIADYIDKLYSTIIQAGTYKAPSIKVAEAAKLIENCQRDVNISFVNEVALILDRMNIDTSEVLNAAGTKWNFLKFKPGLVGGHCIGVDPYYMIHKAESLGYYPALIGAGRRVNDNMGIFVANKVVKLMIQKGISIKGSKALILGITFKENCPDIRNTRVVDIYDELKQFGAEVDIFDPWADKVEVKEALSINLLNEINNKYNLIIITTAHNEFQNLKLSNYLEKKSIIFDVKNQKKMDINIFRL